MKAILYGISIALIAAGVAVGLMVLTNAANVVIGLTLDTAAVLVSGGFIVLGLASVTAALFAVVDAIEAARRPSAAGAQPPEHAYVPPAAAPVTAASATFAAAAATGAAASSAAGSAYATGTAEAEAPPAWRSATYEQDIEPEPSRLADDSAETGAPGGSEEAEAAVEVIGETVVAASPGHAGDLVDRAYEASEELAEDEPPPSEDEDALYVVEETVVRGRAARVLSDGTVEAETDEGWMRFENMEHLEEYLDATAAA